MKIHGLSKVELVEHAKGLELEVKGKKKTELLEDILAHRRSIIDAARNNNLCLELLTEDINRIANRYASALDSKISERKKEMTLDDNSHYLIYRVLGISYEDGSLIDQYQNTGRFLYKYAGAFLEEVAILCLFYANSEGSRKLVKNNQGSKPNTFEIDFLNGNDAIEIKWRDATTDGDHITKEHTRAAVIKSYGYTPIRVMFYYPQRDQAKKVQEALKAVYKGLDGEYYAGNEAWSYIQRVSGYDLKAILIDIADKRDQLDAEKNKDGQVQLCIIS